MASKITAILMAIAIISAVASVVLVVAGVGGFSQRPTSDSPATVENRD